MGFAENGKAGLSGLVEGKLKNERIVDGLVFPKTFLPADPAKAASADDLASLVTANQEALHELLYQHGAILFRGFAVYAVGDFSKVGESFGWEEHPYEGAANRVKRGHRVFTANEAPLNEFIPFHHEMALIRDSCKKVFFHCAVPTSEGGETSILRSDIVVRQMEEAVPETVKQLRTLGIMPVPHTKNADKSGDDEAPVPGRKLWHRLLKTEDEEEARKRAMEKLPCTAVRFNEDGTVDFVYGSTTATMSYSTHCSDSSPASVTSSSTTATAPRCPPTKPRPTAASSRTTPSTSRGRKGTCSLTTSAFSMPAGPGSHPGLSWSPSASEHGSGNRANNFWA